MENTQVKVPVLSGEQMHAAEALAVEQYALSPVQIMENAGKVVALLAKQLLGDDLADRSLVVLAGRGNKGGVGLAAARHLLNWGAWVQIVLAHRPEGYRGAPAQQLAELQAIDAPLAWAEEGWELPPADLLIDALLSRGLRGSPTGSLRTLIQLANSSVAAVLSVDGPSGLDQSTGALAEPHVRAAATVALALPKVGFILEPGRSACGDLFLADIGLPPQLYDQLGFAVPSLFVDGPLLALTGVDGKAWLMAVPLSHQRS